MKWKVPVLGIVYNLVSLASVPVLITGAILQNEIVTYVGAAMVVPTIAWAGTSSYRAYWKRFEE